MRVIRLKHGYAIKLTDSEWDVLVTLVTACEAGPLPDHDQWSPAMKNAYTRCLGKHNGQFLAIDHDRRIEP